MTDVLFQGVINTMSIQAVPSLPKLIDEAKQELDTLLDDSQR